MRLALLCALASVWFLAGTVRAAELAWRSPATCDHRGRVVEEAERLIGEPLEGVEFADFAVTVRALEERRVELQLVTTPRNPALDPSSRTLVGASCAELVEAAALAISMTVSAYQAPPPQPDAPAEPATVQEPARDPLQYALGAAAALDVGAFPAAALGVQVRASLRYRWLTVVPLGVFFPRSTTQARGAGAEFRGAAGGLLACTGYDHPRFTLDGCVGYELGKLHGRGTSLAQPRSGSAPWSAPRAELQLAVPLLARLWLTASAGITVPTVRKRFEIEGGQVHRPAALTGRFGLGLEFRL